MIVRMDSTDVVLTYQTSLCVACRESLFLRAGGAEGLRQGVSRDSAGRLAYSWGLTDVHRGRETLRAGLPLIPAMDAPAGHRHTEWDAHLREAARSRFTAELARLHREASVGGLRPQEIGDLVRSSFGGLL